MTSSCRSFAVIPAAGRSLRMGDQHKLLLPWETDTIIGRVLTAWTESRVAEIVIVVRHDDTGLRQACERFSQITLVTPESAPRDMQESVQLGLRRIQQNFQPRETDRWMLAPADLPTLSSKLINRLIDAAGAADLIVAPRFGGRQGHPVSFSWRCAGDVFGLPDSAGVNSLLKSHSVRWVDLAADDYPDDVDTPADYDRLAPCPSRRREHR